MTGPDNLAKPKPSWYRRLPSVRRFILWNILCWGFGASALVGGILYTEHVVRPIAEGGGDSFGPIGIFEEEQAGKRVFGSAERLNILVAGIDYNYDDKGILFTKGARSDTIVVLSLSREADFFNVVSIPRDTQVLISEDIGYAKINDAYSYGGIEQARETVSEFLGIPIHHHVILKVSGAKDVVDALGGLPIDVEKNMDYDDNWGKLHIHLRKGPQILDGEQAVGYARFRMDEEGDRGRIRRQQQVIRALGRKLKEPALLARLDDLARVVQQSIDTDFKILQMVDLANMYSSFDFAKMRSASIVGDDAIDPNGTSYIVPYEPENRRTVRRLLQRLDWMSKDDLRVRIYFKKAPSYLAYNLADKLYEAGFRGVQVEAIAWDDEIPTDETRLVWYNEVPRLKGVIRAIVGQKASSSGVVPEGRDDDLGIYLGDDEEGRWDSVPEQLLQEREPTPEPETDNERPDIRYQPEFTPRDLPPSEEHISEPYAPEVPAEPEPVTEPEPETKPEIILPPRDLDESVQPDYPRVAPKPEPSAPVANPVAEPAPLPDVIPRREPLDSPNSAPPVPVEVDMGQPMPAPTPIGEE